MKKHLWIVTLLLVLCVFSNARGDSQVHVVYGETYYCGDSFEIIIQDEPQTISMITRSPRGRKVIHAQAGKYDTLFQIHMKIRNMTPEVFNGISPESFKLVGYVRGKPVYYMPEIMEPYDYGGKQNYKLYDKNYYRNNVFAPLRKIDMILVYRVNPILRDWELHINPVATDGIENEYGAATYYEMDIQPCDGVFQFQSIHDGETQKITKYVR